MKTWIKTLEEAKAQYALGASLFDVGYTLDNAWELYKEEKEKEKEKKKITFEETGAGIGRLVGKKNKAYGNSFGESGKILKIIYPNGIRPDQYDNVLAITRILDKLFRIATDNSHETESPFKDIAGYSILKMNELENK